MQGKESFASLVERYDEALKEYGLSPGSRLSMIIRVNVIVRKHEEQGKDQLDGGVIAAYFDEVGQQHYNGKIQKRTWQDKRREIERFLNFVRTGDVAVANPLKGSRYTLLPEFERIADTFLEDKGFHPNTRNDARWAVHKYFSWLGEQDCKSIKNAGAVQLQKFLIDCSGKMTLGSVHDIKLHLSKLYAYLYNAGLSESPYSELLSFTVRRGTTMQPVLKKSEIAAMLESIDKSRADGKRAYAVMMLGVVLGLRACDIVNLKLSDIDWINGEIKILQAKTAETVVLPLTQDVGAAITDYILHARPKTNADKIFIRLCAPFVPLASAVSIGEIYRDCCKAAGLPVTKRFHTLRRTLGTSLVTSGASVNMVAQVLGHADVESTKRYIALDSEHLKICALPFDGIAPIGGVPK